MKARKILIFVILLIIGALLYIVSTVSYQSGISYGESHAEEIRASQLKSVESVKSVKSVKTKYCINELHPLTIKGSGRVIPGTIINISSEVQGVLKSSILLKKGTSFKKGESLFVLQSTDAKLLLAARKSAYLSTWTKTLPDLATDYANEYDKWYSFFNSINVDQSLPSFPIFKTPKEKNFIISRSLLAEYLNIKSDEFKLSKYHQFAPFSGSIVESYTDDGAIVSPGSPVVQIMRNDQLEIEIPLPVKFMNDIKIGSIVTLYENEEEFEGKVTRKGEFINPNTQSVPVYVSPNNSYPLYYGMYVKAVFHFDDDDKVCEIPRKSLFGKNTIYKISKDSTLFPFKLNIRSKDDKYIYATNIIDSTLIVVEPIINAKDNLKVIPIIQ